ncbi:hypothetical protein [Bacillus suaedae]|uniref:Uncharacterized protein n=1 Tax=Halalkalibacter suaedae TaxID=2822140 RepID=A0A940WXN6_9BACI|nr:hypothetical protein [Bacillus suaedae]MBP3952473.1 hypothetical protein [Bacillus suaedae]
MEKQHDTGDELDSLTEDRLNGNDRDLVLRKYFKSKRGLQVEILLYTGSIRKHQGEVDSVGRDFVCLVNGSKRKWIPYSTISGVKPKKISGGIDAKKRLRESRINRLKSLTQFTNVNQDNELFSQTVALERLESNLHSFKNTRIIVEGDGVTSRGKIASCENGQLHLKSFKSETTIPLKEIRLIKSNPLSELLL